MAFYISSPRCLINRKVVFIVYLKGAKLSAYIIATSLLTLLVESCTAALNAFSLSEGLEDHLSADFSTLRTDFISILSILYSATTKIALSLKPSSPQYKASLVPLQDVSNNVAALVHSIRLMRVREGTTVLKEYENIAQNVVIAVRSLAQCLLDESRGNANEEYLVKTGEVHELIDRVRKPGGLSLNNRDAVRRSWLQDSGSLADAYEEIQEICKAADLDVEDEEEFGDGWDELGISSDKKLSASELDRAQKVRLSLPPIEAFFICVSLGTSANQTCGPSPQTSNQRFSIV